MIPIFRSIYPYVYILFIFLISLSKYASAVPNIVLILLIALFPFVIKKNHLQRLKTTPVYLFIALLLLILFNTLFFNRVEQDASIVIKIASTLLLLVLAVPLTDGKKVKKAVVFSVLLSIVVSLVGIYFLYQQQEVFKFASGGFVNDVLLIERLYLGFMCTISIIISVQEIDKGYSNDNKWYFANIVLCGLFVLLISSRIALACILFIFILRFFYVKQLKLQLLYALGLLTILSLSILVNNNLQERFFFTNNSEKNVPYLELIAKWEPRVAIWNCNYILLKNSPSLFTGIGFKQSKNELVSCYKNTIKDPEKNKYFLTKKFNAHNQYIDFFISQGLVVGTLFLVFILQLAFAYRKSYFKLSLVVSLALFLLIECAFHRELGAYMFSIIFILLLFDTPVKTIKDA